MQYIAEAPYRGLRKHYEIWRPIALTWTEFIGRVYIDNYYKSLRLAEVLTLFTHLVQAPFIWIFEC